MSVQAFGNTDVGRVRDHNEDNLLVDLDLGLLQSEPHLGMKIFWAFMQSMSRRLREQDKELRGAAQIDEESVEAPFWE